MSLNNYVSALELSTQTAEFGRVVRKGAPRQNFQAPALPTNLNAAVDVGSLLSFVAGVDPGEQRDILFSVQLAQRAANTAADRFVQTRVWYGKYTEVLEAVGWSTEQFAFASHAQEQGDFEMNKEALSVLTAIATQNQLQVLNASISALGKLAENDGRITLFDYHAAAEGSGNFQIGAVQKTQNGALSMAAGAFYFRAIDQRRRFLFVRYGSNQINFWTAAQKMTFNTTIYAKIRKMVEEKLGQQALDYIAQIAV